MEMEMMITREGDEFLTPKSPTGAAWHLWTSLNVPWWLLLQREVKAKGREGFFLSLKYK